MPKKPSKPKILQFPTRPVADAVTLAGPELKPSEDAYLRAYSLTFALEKQAQAILEELEVWTELRDVAMQALSALQQETRREVGVLAADKATAEVWLLQSRREAIAGAELDALYDAVFQYA